MGKKPIIQAFVLLKYIYVYVCINKFICIVIDCRAIHDVKATDLGLGKVRFKAEVDFDGRVVTRSYLEKQDFDQMLQVSLFIIFLHNWELEKYF